MYGFESHWQHQFRAPIQTKSGLFFLRSYLLDMALTALILSVVAIGLAIAGFVVLYRKIETFKWDE